MDFYSAYAQGFARIAAVTLPVHLADPVANAAAVIEQARACHDDSVAVAVFPELCLTGYSVDDLFLQDTLLATVEEALAEIVAASADLMTMLVIGAPVVHGNRVFNARSSSTAARSSASPRSPTCPTTASSTSGAGSHRATTASWSGSPSPARTSASAPT